MSGHAAINGFNFQNAHAVLDLLRMQLNPDADHARLEGKHDALDFELYDKQGALLIGKQLKTREIQSSWSGNEIMNEVERWSSIEYSTPHTSFEFITNGRLGPSAQLIAETIKPSGSANSKVNQELATRIKANREILKRTQICQYTGDIESILNKCVMLATALQSESSSKSHANSRAEFVVNQLFKIVSIVSGEKDANKRIIHGSEIRLLIDQAEGVELHETWNDEVFSRVMEQLESKLEIPPTLDLQLDKASSEKQELSPEGFLDMLTPGVVGIIHGPSGHGKTEFLKTLTSFSLKRSKLLLRIDAYSYTRGRLTQLVANTLNTIAFTGAFPATGDRILRDPRVIVAVDNASELPAHTQRDLRHELRELHGMNTRCSLVLVGRQQISLRGLVPQNIGVVSAGLSELSMSKQIELLNYWGINAQRLDIGKLISRGGPGSRTPLFLWISSQAALNGTLQPTPADNYEKFAIQKCERIGLESATILLATASDFIANCPPPNQKSIPSLDFHTRSRTYCEKFNIDLHSFERFFFETGLFVRTTGDRISPFHDSFVDFLLAKSVSFSQISAADIDDTEYLAHEFLIQLGISNHNKLKSIATNSPFILPRMARWEQPIHGEINFDLVSSLLAGVIPIGINLSHHSVAGFVEVQFDEPFERTSHSHQNKLSQSLPFTIHVDKGEIYLVTHIWRLYLREKLDFRQHLFVKRPTTSDEYRAMLINFAEQLPVEVNRLLHELIPPNMVPEIREQISPYQYQFVFPPDTSDDQLQYGTEYLLSTEEPTNRLISEKEYAKIREKAPVAWGTALNDVFAKEDSPAMAASIIRNAINQLIGFKWV